MYLYIIQYLCAYTYRYAHLLKPESLHPRFPHPPPALSSPSSTVSEATLKST